MILNNKFWACEKLKAVITFDEDLVYTVYNYEYNDCILISADLDLAEGNSNVNPLGVNESNSLSLNIMDKLNRLSPGNSSSPYYSHIKNGVKVELFISYDGVNYEPYGVWYTTSWSCGFSDGFNDVACINCEDILNTIGNIDMPNIDISNNILACDLITKVFAAIGLNSSQYSLDRSLDRMVSYGAKCDKVRDFLNNMCQLMLGRFIVDRSGIIKLVSLLGFTSGHNEIRLNDSDLGAINNKNTSVVDYNEIKVYYLSTNSVVSGQIYKGSHTLIPGLNTLSDITFSHNVVSIDCVNINTDAGIGGIVYNAYSNGMQLSISNLEETNMESDIEIYGHYIESVSSSVSSVIETGTNIGGRVFEFDSNQLMTSENAAILMNNLKNSIVQLSRKYSIKGIPYTPKLYVGDKVVINNTNTMYDGTYKIIEMSISFNESYDVNMTLIRVVEASE